MSSSTNPAPSLEAIRLSPDFLFIDVLDQLRLPHETVYVKVRGAPAIAIVGMLGLAVEIEHEKQRLSDLSRSEVDKWIVEQLDYLQTSRPTAVNLQRSCDDIKELLSTSNEDSSGQILYLVQRYGQNLFVDDVEINKRIGKHGAEHILRNKNATDQVIILTHCNTGSLATAGHGTALGVIRALHDQKRLKEAFCTETRPYNQGSRLTAYELVYEKIPSCLICDSMAGALMTTHNISAVIVGADRIVLNGDTANKIGTYQLAVLAKHHGIPFYVAAPTTTIDTDTHHGSDIPIEERDPKEMTQCGCSVKAKVAAMDIHVWNPAFDVTPAELITGGIITEHGVVNPPLDTLENLATLKLNIGSKSK